MNAPGDHAKDLAHVDLALRNERVGDIVGVRVDELHRVQGQRSRDLWQFDLEAGDLLLHLLPDARRVEGDVLVVSEIVLLVLDAEVGVAIGVGRLLELLLELFSEPLPSGRPVGGDETIIGLR